MTLSTGPENKFEAKNGVRGLEMPDPKENWLDRNYSNGSMKQMSHLPDINGAIPGMPAGACLENYAGANCESCGAKSLHALYLGYSFVEWICDICGARTETSLNK